MPAERKAIPGWPGYEADTDGNIWSLKRGEPRWCRPQGIGRRYKHVTLSKPGGQKSFMIHILMTRTFLGPPPPGQEVLHGNGNSHDNRLANLRYGTRTENIEDMRRHGTTPTGERNGMAKLSNDDCRVIHIWRSVGGLQQEIADTFRVAQSTVSRIYSGRHRNFWICPECGCSQRVGDRDPDAVSDCSTCERNAAALLRLPDMVAVVAKP